MSMSTYIQAFRDFDSKWNEMMKIKLLCDKNKISYPKEVSDYFGEEAEESQSYLEQELNKIDTKKWTKEWNEDSRQGFEIEVKDIPKEVKTIRFVNSY
jgi:hypothetical protein